MINYFFTLKFYLRNWTSYAQCLQKFKTFLRDPGFSNAILLNQATKKLKTRNIEFPVNKKVKILIDHTDICSSNTYGTFVLLYFLLAVFIDGES